MGCPPRGEITNEAECETAIDHAALRAAGANVVILQDFSFLPLADFFFHAGGQGGVEIGGYYFSAGRLMWPCE